MARTAKKEKVLTTEEKLEQALVPETEQPYKVPENWCWCKLGNLCDFERGITFPASAKEIEPSTTNIPCLRTANIQDELKIDDLIYVDTSFIKGNAEKLSRVEDIIMSSANSRELVGKVSYVSFLPFPMTFGGFVLTIRAKKISSKYLFYFLRFEFLMGKFMRESAQTTNIANINTKKLAAYSFPLPPIAEQKRIVDRIESLFAKLDESKEKAQSVVDGFENRKAAILHKAFTGELTAEWRKNNIASGGHWVKKRLGDCGKWMGGGTPSKAHPEYWDNGDILWVTSKDMKSDLIEDTQLHTNMLGVNNSSTTYIEKPSILFVMRSGILRHTLPIAVVKTPFTVNQDLKALSPDNIDIDYLFWACESEEKHILDNCMKNGTTVESINATALMNFEIAIAPVEEQPIIVSMIVSGLHKEQKAKEAAEHVIEKIDIMKKSILARAFRGELGTNDPADEPAEELLKRVL